MRPRDWLLGATVAAAAVLAGLALSASSDQQPDAAAGFVRASAASYLHLSTDTGGDQWERLQVLTEELPTVELLRSSLLVPRIETLLAPLDPERDVRPWLGEEAAVAQVPIGAGEPQPLLLLSAEDEDAARRSLERAGFRAGGAHRGVPLLTSAERTAAIEEGFVLLGPDEVVRRSLDVHAGATPALSEDPTYTRLRDDLPDDLLAHGWLAQAPLQTSLAGPAALLAGAARAPGLRSGAFGLSLEDERGRLSFRGITSSGAAPGGDCEAEVEDGGSLLEEAPREPAALIGISRVACLARGVIGAPSESQTGAAVRRFLQAVERAEGGVDLERELLPLLTGEAALTVSPGQSVPVISLVIGGVDERRALAVLGRLQPAVIDLVQPERVGQAASFRAERVEGVEALTVELGPGLELSYAAFDGKLVISTSLEGIRAARAEEDLRESEDFDLVLGDRPDRPSAVVLIDLDKLLALADQVGLTENPAYLAVRDDLQKLGVVGGFISREEEDITAELLFKNP